MATVSWERIAGPTAPAAHTDTTLYTVPANTKLVIRSVSIVNTNTTTAEDARLSVGTVTNPHYLWWEPAVAINKTVLLNDLRWVLYAGESLHAWAQGASVTFTIYGFTLSPI